MLEVRVHLINLACLNLLYLYHLSCLTIWNESGDSDIWIEVRSNAAAII